MVKRVVNSMKISVCVYNPDKEAGEQQQRYIAAVLFHADYRAQVLSCCTESALKELTARAPFTDLLFMPATDACIRFGRELRKTNRSTTVVFLSEDASNVYDAFSALPIAFLVSSDKQSLSETVLRAAAFAVSGKRIFCHESRTQILQLNYKDIDYFESEYRIVHIHRTDGTYETITAKLDEVEATLPSDIFCRCHKSYLVNLNNIASVNKTEKTVEFKSGAQVYSSKAQYPQLVAALKGEVKYESV